MCRYVHNTSSLSFLTSKWLFCLSQKHDDNETTLATTKNKTERWVLSTQWCMAKGENGIEDVECIEDASTGMKMRRNSICLQHSIKGSRFSQNPHIFILNLVLNHSIERNFIMRTLVIILESCFFLVFIIDFFVVWLKFDFFPALELYFFCLILRIKTFFRLCSDCISIDWCRVR